MLITEMTIHSGIMIRPYVNLQALTEGMTACCSEKGPSEVQAEVEMAGISTAHLRAGWQDQIAQKQERLNTRKRKCLC